METTHNMINKYEHTLTSMRVYVTERCNANCPNCFNAKSRSDTEMSTETFNQLCIWLSENGITHLKILGGEPTIHKNFETIIGIAQKYFKSISIFSNGLEDKIKNLTLRENDSIIYNFLFNREFSKEKFHLENGGSRSLEVQVHKDSDEVLLTKRIIELVNIDRKKIHFSLTLDCTSNIFKEKQIVVPKLQYIESVLQKNNFSFSYDHKMPFCYLYKTGLHPGNTGSCDIETSAVIDSSLNLRYCLQNPEILTKLKQDNKFIPWQILLNHLYHRYYELRLTSLNKICLNCVFYSKYCNGGCWIPKDYIKREDILNNTDFPTI